MKKFYFFTFLFFIMGVLAYSQETLSLDNAILSSTDKWEDVELSSENVQAYNARKKLFDFSVGIGGLGKYMFVNSYEISYHVGYDDIVHFNKIFKQTTGLSLNRYRNQK